ncbi:MAG: TraB/GumN family protein [Gammaproteobacteria bacterium]|nr:TraB/GumN family protein [Gammaproteobacteria bacterium]
MKTRAVEEPIQSLSIGEGTITILGTAHVSRASADKAKELIESKQHDVVCIELCQSRFNAMTDPNALAKMDLFDVIRSGKASMVTASLALGAYQQRMAEQLGIEPGLEMKTSIKHAKELDLPVVVIDREVGTTLKRVYHNVPFWKRLYIIAGLFTSVVSRETVSEEEIEKLKTGDLLETTFAQFSEDANDLFVPLIDERDRYMTAKLLQTLKDYPGKNLLAVVGAGHVKGMISYLQKHSQDSSYDPGKVTSELDIIPKKRSWLKFIPWVIVALVLFGFYLGFQKGPDLGWSLIWQWVVINGSLSALGAAIAGAHLLTIITAFIAAPITSLNPTIGAGMVTAAMELFIRKPTVNDFSDLRKDTSSAWGWRKNRVARILLIFILSSLGSAIGTYVAGFRIFGQLT